VTTAGGGSIVTAVRLRATVHATQEVRLATGGKTPWPQFSLIEEGNHEPLGGPTPTGPAILATGSTTTYDLFFQATQLYFGPPPRIILASTSEQPTPGNWVLRMDLEDVAGARYEVMTNAVIGASP